MENKILTVQQFAQKHDWPPYGGLRHLIHKANQNKEDPFNKCLIKPGRRVLIDEDEFFKWLKKQGVSNE